MPIPQKLKHRGPLPCNLNSAYLREPKLFYMKSSPFLTLALGLTMILSLGCGEKTPPTSENANPNKGKRPGREAGIMDQKPAAEVLGSTVKRNLRYQPETETNEILPMEKYLEYIRQIGINLGKHIGKMTPGTPTAGTVVVGLNAKGENRLWFVFPEGQPSEAFKTTAQTAVFEVPKPALKKSLLVFGVALTLWGYQETDEEANKITLPAEWKAITDRLKADQPATKLAEMTWSQPVQ